MGDRRLAGYSAQSLEGLGLPGRWDGEGDDEGPLVSKLDRSPESIVDLGTVVERYLAAGKAALLSVGEQIDSRSAAGRLALSSAA